jgi:hypothetical protein
LGRGEEAGEDSFMGALTLVGYAIFANTSSTTQFWIAVLVLVFGSLYELETIKLKLEAIQSQAVAPKANVTPKPSRLTFRPEPAHLHRGE